MLIKMVIKVAVSSERKPDRISWGIMLFGNGAPYSHIYFVLDGRMYHADDKGVCDDDYTEFLKDHYEIASKEVTFNCTPEFFKEWHNKLKLTQVPYSMGQYMGFVLPWFKSWFANGRKKAICSEYVAWGLFDLADREEFMEAEFKTPAQVFEAI